MHLEKQAQIIAEAQVGALLFNETPTAVLAENLNYSNVFLVENIEELSENTGMNEYAIELEEDKKPFFRPIYSLGPVELETLKTYIKTNLANSFIWSSKLPAGAFILFDQKPDESFCFCVDYQGLINLSIKNQYSLLRIGESLDRFGQAKKFTQLDLTNTYYRMRI